MSTRGTVMSVLCLRSLLQVITGKIQGFGPLPAIFRFSDQCPHFCRQLKPVVRFSCERSRCCRATSENMTRGKVMLLTLIKA